MKNLYLFSVLLFMTVVVKAQLISSNPAFLGVETANPEIIFDASLGNQGLKDYSGEVYAHTGVITTASSSDSDWKHAPAWGNDAEKYKMTSLGNNKWKLVISPDIKTYYGISAGEQVLKLAFVFRSGDNSREAKTDAGGDIFLDVAGSGLQVRFTNPESDVFLTRDTTVNIRFVSSQSAVLSLFVDGEEQNTANDVTGLQCDYTFLHSGGYELIAKAETSTGTTFDTVRAYVPAALTEATKPENLQDGINLLDDHTAGFVLYAPGKKNVFLLGDFNDWTFSDTYQMKRDGDYWWLVIDGLDAETLYAFQYAVDNGTLRISDAYSTLILDPWNDGYISSSVFPNLKPYPTGKGDGLVSTFRLRKPDYAWEVPDFEMPDRENLVIYEMLIRDFTTAKSLQAALEKLDYLDTLGVTAIELMPIQEFDGNLSWGYNPNHFFAPDKAYGTPDMYKKFIDECHKRGMAVILDMVFNHATGNHPFAKLYWDAAANKTASGNPWFNVDAPHPYSVFHDFNHEFEGTRDYFKRVLQYWIEEYKIDGYRMDLTKGFTQKSSTEATASGYDQSRIDILSDYYNAAEEVKPDIMFILEHFCENREEQALAEKGMYLWRNINNAFSQAAMGYQSNSSFAGLLAAPRHWVGFAESHDEERNFYKARKWGVGGIAEDSVARFNRIPMNIAFVALCPGPKMIWQFGEFGYDYSIDYSGRTGEKPVVWEWLDNPDRSRAFVRSAKVLNLRKLYPEAFSDGSFAWNVNVSDWNDGRRITLQHDELNMIVLGNFKAEDEMKISPLFPKTGVWHELISGASLNIQNTDTLLRMSAGKLYVFTDREIDLPAGLHRFEDADEFTDRRTEVPQVNTLVVDKIFIETSSEIERIFLYDPDGSMLIADAGGSSEINVSFLENGIYILKIMTSSGIYTEKIFKYSL